MLKFLCILICCCLASTQGGIQQLSAQDEAEALNLFNQACLMGGGSQTQGLSVFCKIAQEEQNFKEVLRHQVHVPVAPSQPNVIFIKPPVANYEHKIQLTGLHQPQKTKIYLFPQPSKHEISATYNQSPSTPTKPLVFFLNKPEAQNNLGQLQNFPPTPSPSYGYGLDVNVSPRGETNNRQSYEFSTSTQPPPATYGQVNVPQQPRAPYNLENQQSEQQPWNSPVKMSFSVPSPPTQSSGYEQSVPRPKLQEQVELFPTPTPSPQPEKYLTTNAQLRLPQIKGPAVFPYPQQQSPEFSNQILAPGAPLVNAPPAPQLLPLAPVFAPTAQLLPFPTRYTSTVPLNNIPK